MRFHDYISLKEADQTQEIDQIFNKAATDIQKMFSQLISKTKEMGDNYQKASLPDGVQDAIIKDLVNLVHKVKKMGGVKLTDPRGQGIETPRENVVLDTFLKNIVENIQEASITQGVGSHGVGLGGKKAYNFTSVITNIYRIVMERMGQLKDAVFKHMGIIRDTHSKVLGLRTTAGEIRNKTSELGTTAGEIRNKVFNPSQPFSPEEEDKAQDSMIALASAVKGGFNLKLKSGNVQIPIDPKSDDWHQEVLRLGQKDKKFKLIGPNGEEEVNMGNPTQIHQALNALGYAGVDDFVPSIPEKMRVLKTRDNRRSREMKKFN